MGSKRLICIFLALFLLSGCAVQVNIAETTSGEETIVTTQPPVELEAVNPLSFRASTESPEVFVLNSRTVAIFVQEFVAAESKTYTHATVLDLYTDAVLAEKSLDGTLAPLPFCSGQTIVLMDTAEEKVHLLDENLQEITEFPVESLSGIVTEDLKYYHYIFGSSLYSLDIDQGTVTEAALDWPLPLETVTGYDPEENLLLVDAYCDPFATAPCVAAIDLDTMTYSMVNGEANGGAVTRSGALLSRLQPQDMTADVTWFDWDSQSEYSLPGLLTNDSIYSTTHISGSNFIFQICYDTKQNTDVVDVRLLSLEEGLYSVSLQEQLKGKKLNSFAALPDGKLLALAVSRRGYQPFLLCPEQLSFQLEMEPASDQLQLLNETIREEYLQTLEGGDLPGALKQYRQWADRLEEKYGVTILLSNQCAAPAAVSSIAITTTDQAGLPNESERIRFALETLETALSQYPEGFFQQFRNKAQERGILILLVEDIGADMNAVGVAYRLGQWYPVALDVTYGGMESTCYHELWHAIEFKITEERPDLLSISQWSQWNPQGFAYTHDLYADFSLDTEYTLLGDGSDGGSYFIDGYGKTFDYEDRARIMEYTMINDRYARLIMKKPALRNKLSAMVAAVREVFDTTGWENVLWEQYF